MGTPVSLVFTLANGKAVPGSFPVIANPNVVIFTKPAGGDVVLPQDTGTYQFTTNWDPGVSIVSGNGSIGNVNGSGLWTSLGVQTGGTWVTVTGTKAGYVPGTARVMVQPAAVIGAASNNLNYTQAATVNMSQLATGLAAGAASATWVLDPSSTVADCTLPANGPLTIAGAGGGGTASATFTAGSTAGTAVIYCNITYPGGGPVFRSNNLTFTIAAVALPDSTITPSTLTAVTGGANPVITSAGNAGYYVAWNVAPGALFGGNAYCPSTSTKTSVANAWLVTLDGTGNGSASGVATSPANSYGGRGHVFVKGAASQNLNIYWSAASNSANAVLYIDTYTAPSGTDWKVAAGWTKTASTSLPMGGGKYLTTCNVTMPNPDTTKLEVWVWYTGTAPANIASVNCLTTN
ncbi:MAG: hypothetical protein WCJ56_06345 [bacterium]